MRYWTVLLLGLLLCSVQYTSANDAVEKLEACGGNFFGLLMTRLNLQVVDYTACQEANAEAPNHSCRGAIQRAADDLQKVLDNYIDCTKDIR